MRILFRWGKIREFHEIELKKKWESHKVESNVIPDDIIIRIDGDDVGFCWLKRYKDDNPKKAESILANTDTVLERLLTDGYCKADDFVNFWWNDNPEELLIDIENDEK